MNTQVKSTQITEEERKEVITEKRDKWFRCNKNREYHEEEKAVVLPSLYHRISTEGDRYYGRFVYVDLNSVECIKKYNSEYDVTVRYSIFNEDDEKIHEGRYLLKEALVSYDIDLSTKAKLHVFESFYYGYEFEDLESRIESNIK